MVRRPILATGKPSMVAPIDQARIEEANAGRDGAAGLRPFPRRGIPVAGSPEVRLRQQELHLRHGAEVRRCAYLPDAPAARAARDCDRDAMGLWLPAFAVGPAPGYGHDPEPCRRCRSLTLAAGITGAAYPRPRSAPAPWCHSARRLRGRPSAGSTRARRSSRLRGRRHRPGRGLDRYRSCLRRCP